MSAETYDALEAAIRAHVADERIEWPILTDWALITASAGADMRSTGYLDVYSDSPLHSIEGLLAQGHRRCVARFDSNCTCD